MYLNLQLIPGETNSSEIPFLEVQFLVDTGADCCILNFETYSALTEIGSFLLQSAKENIQTAGNSKVEMLGVVECGFRLSQSDHANSFPFLIFPQHKGRFNLVGLNFLQRFCTGLKFESSSLTFRHNNEIVELRPKKEKTHPFYSMMIPAFTKYP